MNLLFSQILVSNENLYSRGEGGGQVTDKIVSLSFTGSKDDGSVDDGGPTNEKTKQNKTKKRKDKQWLIKAS